MKSIILYCILISFTLPLTAQGDLLRRVRDKTKDHINDRINDGIDKGLEHSDEAAVDIIKGDDKEKKENESDKKEDTKSTSEGIGTTANQADDKEEPAPELTWSKYDFVPGDKVIFEDNQENEENGEFPSRWDLASGTAEIANFGGNDVIMLREGSTTIVPYLKNSGTDYLPDVFTVELDLYYENGTFNIYLYDRKNQKAPCNNSTNIELWPTSMALYPAKSNIPNNGSIKNKWAHIAIAYTNGKIKGYIDDTRLVNIPHLECNPTGISLYAYHASDKNRYYVKNIRIAEGGVKYYDRVLQDGKIVTNGIRFDVGKATIQPESMGVINEIYKLMNDHPDLKFSVEGHTDSDGSEEANQKLSEQRAEAVMNKLVSMGISKERLSAKGFGESVPIDTNSTAEGKANNRRVEFVKI